MTTEQYFVNTIISLFLVCCLSIPFIIGWWISRNFIKKAIAGVDGVPDIQELRIWAGIIVIFCHAIMLFFLIITTGALKWSYPSEIWYLVFLGTLGAEGLVLLSFLKKRDLEKK